MRISVRVISAVLVLSIAAGCGGDVGDADASRSENVQGEESPDQRIVVAVVDEPPDLDPYGVVFDAPHTQIFEGLTKFDQDAELVPGLASELPAEIDDLTWEIPIREDVKFHDGSVLTADVAADSLNLLFTLSEKESRQMALLLGPRWDRAEAVDDHTLRIHLSERTPLLPQLLATIYIVQPESHEPQTPVGTGPYELEEWNRGQSIVLTRYEAYWGDAPDVAEVEYRFIPEPSTQVASFLAGEVDVLFRLSNDAASTIPEDRLTAAESGDFQMIALNSRDGLMSDVRVRQALNLAIDRQTINDSLFDGLGTIEQCQQLKDGYVGFNADLSPYEYDPDRARELLSEAGAEGATFELLTSGGRYPKDREQAEVITEMWNAVGLNVTTKVLVAQEYLDILLNQPERPTAMFANRSTQLLDGSTMAPYFGAPGVEGPSSAPQEVADAFNAASAVGDIEEREAAWRDFYESVCDEAHFVHLITPPALWAQSEKISALNPVPFLEPTNSRVADIELK